MTRRQLEIFREEFLMYYEDYILIADFDQQENLVVYSTPYLNFDEVIVYVCESLLDTVDFEDHLAIYLYQFGKNDCIRIAIN